MPEQVCCKVKKRITYTTKARFYYNGPGGITTVPAQTYSYSKCTQEGFVNYKGLKPERFCECHYKENPSVTVKGAYSGKCEWCNVSHYQTMSHSFIKVDCFDGKPIYIESYPDWFDGKKRSDSQVHDFSYYNLPIAVEISTIKVPKDVALSIIAKSRKQDFTWTLFSPFSKKYGNCIEYFIDKWDEFKNWCD